MTAPIARKRVLAVGQFVVDMLVKPVERHPPADVADIVDFIRLDTGGCTLNAARVLHKLGVPVRLSGLIGDDRLGEFLLTEIARSGMDSSGLREKPGAATSSSIVLISPSGERSFFHCPGATAEMTLVDIREEDLEWSDIVHLAGTCELNSLDITAFLEKAKRLGKVVSLDVDYDPQGRWGERVKPWLPYLSYFLPSRKEAAVISGQSEIDEILDYFAESGVKTTVVKMGKEGCAARAPDRRTLRQPAFKVDVVDATGAGDAFVGGFLAGVAEGCSLKECLRMGCAAGALTVTALGAGAGLTDRAQFDAFIQEHTK
ncbi:MAG: carbohydrate kinase family protein [bacterium]|nr:carbohydrate kinase family protein [bacterium]